MGSLKEKYNISMSECMIYPSLKSSFWLWHFGTGTVFERWLFYSLYQFFHYVVVTILSVVLWTISQTIGYGWVSQSLSLLKCQSVLKEGNTQTCWISYDRSIQSLSFTTWRWDQDKTWATVRYYCYKSSSPVKIC